MCLVCSKFDMASNTCSWVGCDVCLHWCHADCALREAYIRNGRSASGSQGTTEMQFHCVACDHPSEMFGFVKEVFQNFAKDWTAETFCRELEYVKRIFRASKDVRGRRLHEIADQMLAKLANKSNLPEVYNYIIVLLTESDPSKFGNASGFFLKEQGNGSNGAGPSHDAAWFKSVYTEKNPQLERSTSLRPSFHSDLNDKCPVEPELLRSSQKEPLFDELESIVRIKQAEAKMFQARADDARREAEGLKRIAIAKSEKIKEEFTSRISKLRIVEVEEMRKQKFEEFQALERAHREYFSMKTRMEADIKDLLLKMEAAKRNITL
ncbi:protein OBERON 4 [Populus alba x Populus x berolinensis]|nr:protein OBERON 4 [Populus alba x Populus x berolinensis]